MTNTVYAVSAEDWGWESNPVLKKLFYEKPNADSYAEELRNEVYDNWHSSGTDKVWYQVTVDDFEIQ